MQTARLSVIVTTHHRPILLRRALTSLIKLGSSVQIVLCADENSHETREVAAQLLREGDIFAAVPGLRGPAETRNLGLQLAAGDYIGFLDDDDTIDPAVVELFAMFDGEHVFYANYRKIFEIEADNARVEQKRVERKTSSFPASAILVRSFIQVSAFFGPRHILRSLNFSPELSSSEDWEFLIKLYKVAPFKHVDIVVSNWHILESQTSRNKVGKNVRFKNTQIIYEMHPTPDEGIQKRRLRRLKEFEVPGDGNG
jgi:glycosyltransferase involved in cell wall biosynthesis